MESHNDNKTASVQVQLPRPSDDTLRAIVAAKPGSRDDALYYAIAMAFELLVRRQEDEMVSDVAQEVLKPR